MLFRQKQPCLVAADHHGPAFWYARSDMPGLKKSKKRLDDDYYHVV
jgi:hypothetical protein